MFYKNVDLAINEKAIINNLYSFLCVIPGNGGSFPFFYRTIYHIHQLFS